MPFVAIGALIHAYATAAVIAFLLPSSLFFVVLLHRLFLHPLSPVPGPKLAAISNVWHTFYARNGRMLEIGKTLHEKYGPAVRVGPNEVWLNSKDAFRSIYSAFLPCVAALFL
jgi:hypothetical protein